MGLHPSPVKKRLLTPLVYAVMTKTLGMYVWRVEPKCRITANRMEMACRKNTSARMPPISHHAYFVTLADCLVYGVLYFSDGKFFRLLFFRLRSK